jgi:hypothetical protein
MTTMICVKGVAFQLTPFCTMQARATHDDLFCEPASHQVRQTRQLQN